MRAALFGSVGLVVLIVASPTLAQTTPTAQDGIIVQACLDRRDNDLGSACIGIVANPCITAVAGDDAKARACAARERAVWDAQLAAALRRVQAGGFKDIVDAVTRAQKAWQSSHRGLCAVFNKIDPGMLPGGGDYCTMHETASRALLIRRLGDALSEH